MFRLFEKVVYPGHGVAEVSAIVEKQLGSVCVHFYALSFLQKGGTILVPQDKAEDVGLRALSTPEHVEAGFQILFEPAKRIYHDGDLIMASWNRRNKDYQNKLRGGQLSDLMSMYRDLRIIEQHKELSFGEKNLLQQIENLISEEVAIVEKRDKSLVMDDLRNPFIIKKEKKPTRTL